MNEMYDMSIVTHYYGVIGILVIVLLHLWMLKKAVDLQDYKRQMSLFNPISSIALVSVIFTGIVMMAAKHLDFSIENIIMIVFSLALIYLELKRAKTLKYLDPRKENALKIYKENASKILLYEVLLTLSISFWMLF